MKNTYHASYWDLLTLREALHQQIKANRTNQDHGNRLLKILENAKGLTVNLPEGMSHV